MKDKLIIYSLRVKIDPQIKAAFIEWQTDLHQVIAAAPGFVSLEILSPTQSNGTWNIVERFMDENAAAAWIESPENKQLMTKLQTLVANYQIQEESLSELNSENNVTEVFITVSLIKKTSIANGSQKYIKLKFSLKDLKEFMYSPPQRQGGTIGSLYYNLIHRKILIDG